MGHHRHGRTFCPVRLHQPAARLPCLCRPQARTTAWFLDSATGRCRTPLVAATGSAPENQGSLRGELTQGALRYPVVADMDGRDFYLEESHDGRRIAATWLGEMAQGTCVKVVQGERTGLQEHRRTFRSSAEPANLKWTPEILDLRVISPSTQNAPSYPAKYAA